MPAERMVGRNISFGSRLLAVPRVKPESRRDAYTRRTGVYRLRNVEPAESICQVGRPSAVPGLASEA
jgi:hypothetical protein